MTLAVMMEHKKQRPLKRGYDESSFPTKPAYSADLGRAMCAYYEYPSAPKRKRLSLNSDGLSIPSEVLCVTRLSTSDRKDLMAKLSSDLEKIHDLERKYAQLLKLKVVHRAAQDTSAANFGIVGHTGSHVCCGPRGKFESAKVASEAISVAAVMKQCETLLKKLMSHKLAIIYFNAPVDVVQWNIPDYFNIIKEPMDLGTVLSKIRSGQYTNPYMFAEDMRLTFNNAIVYNPPGNLAHSAAQKLSKMFEAKWKVLDKKLDVSNVCKQEIHGDTRHALRQKCHKMHSRMESGVVITEHIKHKLTLEERQQMWRKLDALQSDLPSNIVSFLEKRSSNIDDNGDTYLEIDTNAYSDDEMFELKRLLDGILIGKQKDQPAKSDPSELEALNVSGVSNPSQQMEGPELIEDNVDICGVDLPTSSNSPISGERNMQVTAHSRSGSDSDSDPDSSSTNEPHDGSADSKKNMLGKDRSESHVDKEKSVVIRSFNVSGFCNDGDVHERVTHPASPEGENAKLERQVVSPEKLSRAALLRSRFADTIVKAQEKMRSQGEINLRREREVLQKMQQDAEEMRAQAELEARRQRELDREAARKLLQQMEKTVEINDCHAIQLLDKLRVTAPAASLADVASPNLSQDGLGVLNLGSSNALEQLGLFMRADDDEDEDAVEVQID